MYFLPLPVWCLVFFSTYRTFKTSSSSTDNDQSYHHYHPSASPAKLRGEDKYCPTTSTTNSIYDQLQYSDNLLDHHHSTNPHQQQQDNNPDEEWDKDFEQYVQQQSYDGSSSTAEDDGLLGELDGDMSSRSSFVNSSKAASSKVPQTPLTSPGGLTMNQQGK